LPPQLEARQAFDRLQANFRIGLVAEAVIVVNAKPEADLAAIAQAAVETVRRAGLAPAAVDVLYFTGGSTGLTALVDRIAAAFPRAQRVRGERYASVAQGLGLHAQALFQRGG
jgi:hypothetical chaperone protein